MPPLLEVRDLVTGFGRSRILNGVCLGVHGGARIGLFGPNGHGKTTLLRTISGLLGPWAGEIRLAGEPIGGLAPRRIVARGLIHVPQDNQLFADMTVAETLSLGAHGRAGRGAERRNRDMVHTLFPRLAERRDQRVMTLSGGERQMLAIGAGLMGAPKLLLLDEPTLGLAPKVKQELHRAIAQIGETGTALVIVEQDIEFLLSLVDRLYMIDHGEVVLDMPSDAALDQPEIMSIYFGKARPA